MHALSLKRFVSWLFRMPRSDVASTGRTNGAATSLLEFDPLWHGDHWQNLLASPMDARHYVMEDWSVPPEEEASAYSGAEDKQRGRRRLRG